MSLIIFHKKEIFLYLLHVNNLTIFYYLIKKKKKKNFLYNKKYFNKLYLNIKQCSIFISTSNFTPFFFYLLPLVLLFSFFPVNP